MNILNDNRIREVIDHGYDFDIGKYISEGFEIVKKELGLFIAYTLVIGLIIGTISTFSSLLQFIAPESIALQLSGQMFTQLITQLISPPLIAGYLLVSHKLQNNERIDFGDFFKGFDYYAQLVTQGLIVVGITLALAIPFVLIIFIMGGFDLYGFSDFGGFQVAILMIAGLLVMCVYIYIMTSYMFASAFVIFGDMKAWDALETSRKVVGKNFWLIFGFGIVLMLLFVGGYILCCVGLLFAIPAVQASIYVAFSDIMHLDRLDDEDSQDDILDHLVD